MHYSARVFHEGTQSCCPVINMHEDITLICPRKEFKQSSPIFVSYETIFGRILIFCIYSFKMPPRLRPLLHGTVSASSRYQIEYQRKSGTSKYDYILTEFDVVTKRIRYGMNGV